MRRLSILLLPLPLFLAGCETLGGLTSPAPLQRVVIDDRAVRYSFLTLDTLASLADAAMDAKLVAPGTPRALAIADGLELTKKWLNAASAAQKAGSLTDYNEAFAQAAIAMEQVKKALGGSVSQLEPSGNFAGLEDVVTRLRA